MNAVDSLEIRQIGDSDLPQFVEIHNSIWPELSISLEQLRRDDVELKPEQREFRWLARHEGRPVGFGFTQRQLGGEEGYWYLGMGVVEDWRGNGIGTRFHDLGMEIVSAQPWIKVSTQVRETLPEAIRFAESKGFAEQKRDCFSTLDLKSADLRPIEVQGIRFVPFEEIDSPEFRRQFHELFEEIRIDVPRANPPKRFEFDEFEALVLSDPEWMKAGTFVAFDGEEAVGFSGVFENSREGYADQWLTGVRRPYRGRDIAKALKLQALSWLKAQGCHYVQTDNDARNAPMLAINAKLGFVQQPALLSMAKYAENTSG